MLKVAIIQREIPHYRSAFFERLYKQANEQGLDVTVYCGAAHDEESPRQFQCQIVPTRFLAGAAHGPMWFSGLRQAVTGSDIIVVPHELRCLTVPYLWLQRRQLATTWIWWGHGYNFHGQDRKHPLFLMLEAIKRFTIMRGDGLITYTARGADYWRKRGMSADQVIPYFNTIDVEGYRESAREVTRDMCEEVRTRLDLRQKRILLFSGRLYPGKQVDFLLKAVGLLQKERKDIALLILGDGAERPNLMALCRALNLQSVHFLGEQIEASVYFQLADLLVLPCLVGLAIVHGFAYGLPLATTDHDQHGPEIEYLSKENGIMTAYDVQAYADGIRKILDDPPALEAMRRAASLDGDRLTLTKAVANFTTAILKLSRNIRASKE